MHRAAAVGTAWVLLGAASLALAQAGPAQDVEAAATAAEPARPSDAGEVIRASDVAGRAAETDRELRDIRAVAGPSAAVDTIAAALPAAGEGIAQRASEATVRIAAATRLQSLDDIEKRWVRERTSLEAWNATLTRRARLLERHAERLGQLRDFWSAAGGALRGAAAPAAVIERAEAMLAVIAEVRALVSERSAQVLALQAEVVGLAREADDVVAQVGAARAAVRSQLFVSDTAPLWTAVARGGLADDDLEREREALGVDLAQVAEYAAQRRPAIAVHLLVIAVLAVVLLVLRHRVRSGGEDGDGAAPDASSLVLSRPIASAILLGYVGARLVYPAAPSFFYGVIGLLGFVPILRVIPRMLDRETRPAFYVLASFFVVDRLRELLSPLPAADRLVFAFEVAVAVVLFARMLRRGRLPFVREGAPGSAVVRLLVVLAVALLLVSLVANLLGGVALGQVLGEAVLACSYVAVGIFAMYRVLVSTLALLLRSRTAARLNMVRRHRPLILQRCTALLRLVAVVAWVLRAIEEFTVRDELAAWGGAALAASLEVGELSLSLGRFLAFFAVFGVAVLFSRGLRFVLEEDVLARMRLPRGVPYAVSTTLHYVILFFGGLAALAATGIDLGRFSLLAGALGVGVGFGLQNVVNNFVSGLILLFERPIQTGDVVEAGSLLGEVRQIGIRASTLRTLDGAEVIVPNANLISEQVVNWTLSDRQRRVEVRVGVRYGTDPEQVLALLLRVAGEHERILERPEPDALFLGFGDSSLDFQLRAWTADFARWMAVRSELNVAVNRALAEAGIEIPFPQRDLHLRSVATDAGAALRDAEEPSP